jgi:transcriptional regulator with XRE-family HTH domain
VRAIARPTKRELGERIRRIRERQHLTQREVADALEIGEGGYRSYEAGRTEPSMTQVPVLAHALGVHPVELFEDAPALAARDLVGAPAFHSPEAQEVRLQEFARTVAQGWDTLHEDEQAAVTRAASHAAELISAELASLAVGLVRRERSGAV